MIYDLFSLPFLFWSLICVVAIFVSFYLPGRLLVQRTPLKTGLLTILLANVVGVVMWGVQGYIFGYLQLRWLSYVYVLVAAWLTWRSVKLSTLQHEISTELKKWRKSNRLALAMIAVGTVLQVMLVFGSGVRYQGGVGYFQTNAVDGVMHVAFIQSIAKKFPPVEPGAFELPLTNYHYWSDLVMAELSRVWGLSASHLFFQWLPIYISVLTGVAAYCVVRAWGGSRRVGNWSLFLLYFSGDAAYLFMLLLQRRFGFDTPAIDNGVTQFLNMPHAMAKCIFLVGLLPLTFWLKTKKPIWGALTVLLFATLFGFKIYFGLFAAIGFSLVVGVQVLKTFAALWKKHQLSAVLKTLQQEKLTIGLWFVFAAIAAAIYFPPNQASGGLFYSPLEWPKLFLGYQNLNWQGWWLRHQVYEEHHNVRNLILLDAMAIIIGLVCIFGTRLIGFLPNVKTYRRLPFLILVFFVPSTLIFTWLGLYTLQVSGLFNVFNFFAVGAVGLALFGAFILDDIQTRPKWFSVPFLLILVILTIPRPLNDAHRIVRKYWLKEYDQLYTYPELEALLFLRQKTDSNAILQSHPENLRDHDWPYVSAFTNRLTYLSGDSLMRSHNQPITEKVQTLEEIFELKNSDEFTRRLSDHHINYVYLEKKPSQKILFEPDPKNLKVVFENEKVIVLQNIWK